MGGTVQFLFPKWMNQIPLAVTVAAPVLLISVVGFVWYFFSPQWTDVGYQPKQPVAFSHKLHAGEMGMDCRYCHSTIERAAFAAVPPTQTCMGCHSLVKKDSVKLAKVRESWNTDKPIEWIHVHMLPDYARFDHSAHLAVGVGCVSCHGRIDQMQVVMQKKPLSMGWCLECHRNPTPNLRPATEVTNMTYDAQAAGYDPATDPKRTHAVNPPQNCSSCHH
jgi:Cytochrome c7 and related cytochrome c/Class III cytochrome C family